MMIPVTSAYSRRTVLPSVFLFILLHDLCLLIKSPIVSSECWNKTNSLNRRYPFLSGSVLGHHMSSSVSSASRFRGGWASDVGNPASVTVPVLPVQRVAHDHGVVSGVISTAWSCSCWMTVSSSFLLHLAVRVSKCDVQRRLSVPSFSSHGGIFYQHERSMLRWRFLR